MIPLKSTPMSWCLALQKIALCANTTLNPLINFFMQHNNGVFPSKKNHNFYVCARITPLTRKLWCCVNSFRNLWWKDDMMTNTSWIHDCYFFMIPAPMARLTRLDSFKWIHWGILIDGSLFYALIAFCT